MIEKLCGIGDEASAEITRQIAIHRELGLAGLELRGVDNRGLHELTDAEVGAAAKSVADAGLTVPVVATPLGGWAVNVGVSDDFELDILRRAARSAKRFGCRSLRIMSYPNDGRPEAEWRAEAIRKVRVLAEAAAVLDVQLLHENCNGWAGTSAERSLELLSEVDGLRLLFDIGNGVAYRYPSAAFLREVLPYVDHVHVKDGYINRGEAVFCWPGEGGAELVECLRLLRSHGYQGWYSVEPHIAKIPHLDVSQDPTRMANGYIEYVRRLRKVAE